MTLVFKGISILFSIVAVLIYIPTNSARDFPFLYTLSSIYYLQIFDDGRFDWCEVIPHCSFNLNFSNSERCSASFCMFISHLYVFFGEMSVQVFCPLFDWVALLVVSCMSCLYILEINPLFVVSFPIISSHSEGYLFILFIVYFAVQKFVSLIRSHQFIVFISITL